MSRIRTAAIGAVLALGMAGVAGAQTQAQKDSAAAHAGHHGQMGDHSMRGMQGMRDEHGMQGMHGEHGMRGAQGMRGDHGKLMADLKLTDAQKNQIKAVHTKYEPQFKALRQQEQNEVRGVLTADQRARWDSAQAQRKTKMEARMKHMKDRGALKKSGKA